jgi:hypothetical protein
MANHSSIKRLLESGAALRGHMPLYKCLGNKILTWTQNQLLGTHFSEFHSGYRAYSMQALRKADLSKMTNSWHFDTQIILDFLRQHQRIVEVPIPTYLRESLGLSACIFRRYAARRDRPASAVARCHRRWVRRAAAGAGRVRSAARDPATCRRDQREQGHDHTIQREPDRAEDERGPAALPGAE